MNPGYDYKQYAILYVDDEEQSLKYFHKAFEKEFRVITAASVDQAMKVLEQNADVGLVMTDQRMPGKTGVDLLGHLRQNRRDTVRILTTAYSDLESAIEAVNSGAIYKYVVKPWNIRDLRGVLLRAMEFYIVQRERDALFREKLSVLQRLVVTDRVRSLAFLAAGLSHHIRNSMQAVAVFLQLAPDRLREEWPDQAALSPDFWEGLWQNAQQESERILHMVQKVTETVVQPEYSFDASVRLDEAVRKAADRASSLVSTKFQLDLPDGLSVLKADDGMVHRLCEILLERAARMNAGGTTVSITAEDGVTVWNTPGVRIRIGCDGAPWSESQLASLFTAFSPSKEDPRELGLDLLWAFFVAFHHGGDLIVHTSAPSGPGFELLLPCNPTEACRPDLAEGCLEKLFLRFEIAASTLSEPAR